MALGARCCRVLRVHTACAARPLGLRRLSALWTGLAAACLAGIASNLPAAEAGAEASRWTAEKAQAWAGAHPQPVGCNYIPAYAVNQLEMWQAETFDLRASTANWAGRRAWVSTQCASFCTTSPGGRIQPASWTAWINSSPQRPATGYPSFS